MIFLISPVYTNTTLGPNYYSKCSNRCGAQCGGKCSDLSGFPWPF